MSAALVEIDGLRKVFASSSPFGRARRVHAVDDVSFEVRAGETFGLVGESGCGKSTLARCIVRLLEPSEGAVRFDGVDITHASMRSLRPLRRDIQLIFQDPFASLNPRKRIGDIIEDALRLHSIGVNRDERRQRVIDLLGKVGLAPSFRERLPSELSGGQRQRVGIARALALNPRLIVADEPVSALDVSVQAEILNLLKDLQAELGLTMVFISHDLGVIRHLCDRVGVMYLGKLVELAPADQFFDLPLHPYSDALLSAIPLPDPDAQRRTVVLEGDVPSPLAPPSGCRFHTRCPRAQPRCAIEEPTFRAIGKARRVACHYPLGEPASG
jgi:peptide/nickel transport system ATP-binding protein/oligopeptide transport system ATP-binding protein